MQDRQPLGCSQRNFFDIANLKPYISLAKPVNKEWNDMGKWVRKCTIETDGWQPTSDPTVFYHTKLGDFKQSLSMPVHVERSIEFSVRSPHHVVTFTCTKGDVSPAKIHPRHGQRVGMT